MAVSFYLLIPFIYFVHCLIRSSLAPTSLFSVSKHLFLFYFVCSFVLFFIFYIYVRSCGICFFLSDLFRLSIITSRTIHLASNGKISYFLMAGQYSTEIYMCVYISLPHLLYLLMDT